MECHQAHRPLVYRFESNRRWAFGITNRNRYVVIPDIGPLDQNLGASRWASRAITLILETAVANFTEPVKEHGAGQRVFGLRACSSDLDDADWFKWWLVTRLLGLPL